MLKGGSHKQFCRGTEVLAKLVKGGSKKFPLLRRRGGGVEEHNKF